MLDIRPALLILGSMLIALSVSMALPVAVDGSIGNLDWEGFAFAAALAMFIGVGLVLTNRIGAIDLNIRQAVVLTMIIWLVMPVFAALPFMYSDLSLSFTDAYFESMSGLTTTGSTVITGLDTAAPGILLWRGILQWLGGLGIIVMAISILPMLRVGGMQMFRVEAFETEGKTLPRMAQISGGITAIYILLTLACAAGLWFAGMTGLEAFVHAMTTIATGGYSTSDGSVGHFDSAAIDVVITAGMVVSGVPFLLYFKAVRGDVQHLVRDSQVRWYLTILSVATLAVSAWLVLETGFEPLLALRYASFSVVSVMTGTGYASADYTLWGAFPIAILFFLTFVGGCAGSTACGIKVFRFQILWSLAVLQVRRIVHPHAALVARYNNNLLTDPVVQSVWGFFFLFVICFAVLSVALTALGLDFVTAISSAATAISNVGPGLGNVVGPSGTFQTLPDAAKWLLSGGMLIGRLEVFTIIVLFSRTFWRA